MDKDKAVAIVDALAEWMDQWHPEVSRARVPQAKDAQAEMLVLLPLVRQYLRDYPPGTVVINNRQRQDAVRVEIADLVREASFWLTAI
jgi:hypothetical protein